MSKKATEWSGLLKVPDSVLLKDAMKEIGQLKSYIEELEHKVGKNKEESLSSMRRRNNFLTEENFKLKHKLELKKAPVPSEPSIWSRLILKISRKNPGIKGKKPV